MKIYDITQEQFSCVVFPGDPKPERQILAKMSEGDLYNLTAFSMCAHNASKEEYKFSFFLFFSHCSECPKGNKCSGEIK